MSGGELFVEVLCEELPAEAVRPALAGFEAGVRELLAGLEHGPVRTFATPRRLAVLVEDVPAERPREERLVTGPAAERAFDADGNPTKAALGFARGKGVDPSALERVTTERGDVVAARVTVGGEKTRDVVAAGLDEVVRSVPFVRSMEWGEGGVRWGRPIHAVSALFWGEVIEGEAAGLPLGNRTRGHRLAENTEFTFSSAAEWLEGLRARQVEPDLEARAARIRAELERIAGELGADPIGEEELIEEVLHLVEWPTGIAGTFDEELLALPPRLLVESMRVHQRYFPVHVGGELTHRFIVIANNPWADPAVVAEGNARVLRARFYDARFFLAEDRKLRLEEHGARIDGMQWIRGLGTMAHKAQRIAVLGAKLAPLVGADPAAVRRAGELSKCDLASQMVGEFPELQGHMGRLYALHQGEPEEVAAAIEEHYLPRFAGDALPATPAGAALALAERIDTLVGCFGIGLVPKGGDPQGLRRAAMGLFRIVLERGLRLDLEECFRDAARGFHAAALAAADGFDAWREARGEDEQPRELDSLAAALSEFVLTRFQAARVAEGVSADLVEAVRAASPPDLVLQSAKLDALREVAAGSDWVPILTVFKRVLNITREASDPPPEPASLTEDCERALAAALEAARSDVRAAAARLDYRAALTRVLALQGPIADLFDQVLVEDPDPAVAARRRGLLLEVAALFRELADFSRISTRSLAGV